MVHRCRHVNLVTKTNVPGEEEYLFAAYSTFVVKRVRWSTNPTIDEPHPALAHGEQWDVDDQASLSKEVADLGFETSHIVVATHCATARRPRSRRPPRSRSRARATARERRRSRSLRRTTLDLPPPPPRTTRASSNDPTRPTAAAVMVSRARVAARRRVRATTRSRTRARPRARARAASRSTAADGATPRAPTRPAHSAARWCTAPPHAKR